MRVPIAFIQAVCYPTSYRLPKLTRLEVAKPVTPSAVKPHYTVPVGSLGYFRNQQGNLDHGEYRFFMGHVNKDDKSGSCRWCREPIMSTILRKKHKNKGQSCQEKLGRVYQQLIQAKTCAVCNKHTLSDHWGVPLCLGECRDTFKFTIPGPLRLAIDKWKVDHNERLTAQV
jgi:hypothetical protein